MLSLNLMQLAAEVGGIEKAINSRLWIKIGGFSNTCLKPKIAEMSNPIY